MNAAYRIAGRCAAFVLVATVLGVAAAVLHHWTHWEFRMLAGGWECWVFLWIFPSARPDAWSERRP